MTERYNYLVSLEKSMEMYQTLTTNANLQTEPVGHTMLYKSGPIHELEEFLHMRTEEESHMQFQTLYAKGRGDFDRPPFHGCYFSATRQAAVEYAAWKKQVTDIPVGILTIAVPDCLLASTAEITQETWKRYVWHCNHFGQLPADLQDIPQYHWIAGPICYSSKQVFECYTHQNELPTWKLENGDRAVQYCTNSDDVLKQLCGLDGNKFWLEEVEMPSFATWVRKDDGKGVCGQFKCTGSSGC